jgi:uncharacterized membrane protein YqjE
MSDSRADPPQNIATAIADISEKASLLIREEIELAKTEIEEKGKKLVKGAIVGAVAGVFFLTALVMALFGGAWLLYYYLPGNDFTYFWGFFAMAVILVVLGVLAGLIAARAVKKGSPPVPTMAIAEAQKIREAVSAPSSPPPPTPPPARAPAPPPAAPAAGARPASAAAPPRSSGPGLAADAVFAKPNPERDGA